MKTPLLIAILIASASLSRALPVEISPGPHNTLTAHVASRHGRLHVFGTLAGPLPGLRHPSSHIEVDLLNARGQTIAAATEQIGKPSRHPQTAHGRKERYSVSFPANLAGEAARVRIVFHNHGHCGC